MPSSPTDAAPDAEIRVVIGLGNPGRDYEGTRHNIGFEIVDRMASDAGVSWKKERKWQAEVARAGSVMLVKPQTFMNLSGQTAAYIAGFFKMPPAHMLVVYDDNDLELGTLRFRANGSAGGHNGIKSMIQCLGSDKFPRLKFGIAPGKITDPNDPGGPKIPRQGSMTSHVLGRFATSEQDELEKSLAIAVDAVNCALSRGLPVAMNQFNQKPNKPRKKPRRPASDPTQETLKSPESPAPETSADKPPEPES